MAQLYSTGPVDVFVSSNLSGIASGVALFLGHGKLAPDIDVDIETTEVECDLGGKVPLDVIYAGQRGKVSVLLTRYNEATVRLIQDRAVSAPLVGRGTDDPGGIGALFLSEGLTWCLYLRFPFAPKPFQQNVVNGVCPPGYRFVASYLRGPDKIIAGSTSAKLVQCHFDCLRAFDFTVTNPYGTGRSILFDHNLAGLPGID